MSENEFTEGSDLDLGAGEGHGLSPVDLGRRRPGPAACTVGVCRRDVDRTRPRARARASRGPSTWRRGSRRFLDVLADLRRLTAFFRAPARLANPMRLRRLFVARHLLFQPGGARIGDVELGVLPGEVLVMEVEPLVFVSARRFDHLVVPDLVVGDFGVVEGHRHRVVPGRAVGRGVDRDPGGLFEHHRLHVGLPR